MLKRNFHFILAVSLVSAIVTLLGRTGPALATTVTQIFTQSGLWGNSTSGPGFGVVANGSADLESSGVIVVTPKNCDDGTGDMTVALQTALNNAVALGTSVELMPGAYSISGPLTCGATQIRGERVASATNTPSTAARIVVNPKKAFDVGSSTAMMNMTGHCVIDGIFINAAGSATNSVSPIGWGNVIDHSEFMNGVHNLYIPGASPTTGSYTGIEVQNSIFLDSTSDNIFIGPRNANGYIHRCSIWGAGGSATGSGNGILFSAPNAQWIITDNYFQQNMGDGLLITGTNGSEIQINNNAFDANYHCGLELASAGLQHVTVVGNMFMATGYTAKYSTGRSGASHVCISNAPNNVTFGQNVYQALARVSGLPPYPDYVYSVTDGKAPTNTAFYEKAMPQHVGVYSDSVTESLLSGLMH